MLLCPWDFSRHEYWSGLLFPIPGKPFPPRDRTCVSCTGRQILYHCTTWEAHLLQITLTNWQNYWSWSKTLYYIVLHLPVLQGTQQSLPTNGMVCFYLWTSSSPLGRSVMRVCPFLPGTITSSLSEECFSSTKNIHITLLGKWEINFFCVLFP